MNKSNWYVVKEDDRYVVLDNKELNKLVPSITKLNPQKATSGHSVCFYFWDWDHANK